MRPVTLQINLAPGDHRLAAHLLPHQLRALGSQVDEVLLVVDLHRSAGRFSENWETGRDGILTLASTIPGARILTVDYGAGAAEAVSREFFGGRPVPRKDHRGGPYYSYFFGLHSATHSLVLHCDADMFFGGGSRTWVAEAVRRLEEEPSLLVCAPLPGPPAPDGKLRQLKGESTDPACGEFQFAEMSTRCFLLDRQRFQERIQALTPRRPSLRNSLLAWLDGNPAQDLPEHLFSRSMRTHGLVRRDFLGSPPGLWSLHPPYRSEDFYQKLPSLIKAVEGGHLPEGQLGDHDINASLVDWTEAHERMGNNRWWQRLARRLRNTVRT